MQFSSRCVHPPSFISFPLIYLRIAETLKYYYLLFLDEDPWPLDEIVFNTEAHPLPVFKWSDEDVLWFKVPV